MVKLMNCSFLVNAVAVNLGINEAFFKGMLMMMMMMDDWRLTMDDDDDDDDDDEVVFESQVMKVCSCICIYIYEIYGVADR